MQLLKFRSNCEDLSLFDLSSAVQIYFSYIYIFLFILYGYITISQYDLEHCSGIAEVMGSNRVQA